MPFISKQLSNPKCYKSYYFNPIFRKPTLKIKMHTRNSNLIIYLLKIINNLSLKDSGLILPLVYNTFTSIA